ncbi:MAG: helix-turn-helix domain-containing protein [Egibacteraceae bacterium]
MSALADLLRHRGWSQARLATESGVSVKTIARWLAGQTTPELTAPSTVSPTRWVSPSSG